MVSRRSSTAPTPSLSTSETLQRAAAIAISVIAITVRCYVSWRTHLTADGAFTTLRYAENIAAGHGVVYKSAEHVLSIGGPLYALLLSVFSSISYTHLHVILAGKTCNIAAEGITCYLMARLLAHDEVNRPIAGLFAASIYALSSAPIAASIGGTEVGLVTCVCLAMVYAYVSGRPYWLYTLGAVLFLLSFNGLFLFAILAGSLAVKERKLQPRAGAIALIIMIPWLIFATAYYGSPIPTAINTAWVYGRTAVPHTDSALAGTGAFAAQFASGWTMGALCLLFVLGTILVVCQAVMRAESGVMAAPLIWCLTVFAAMLFARIPVASAYFVPTLPVYIAVAFLAGAAAPIKFSKLWPDLAARYSGRAVPGSLILLVLLGIVHLGSVVDEVGALQRPQVTPAASSRAGREVPIK